MLGNRKARTRRDDPSADARDLIDLNEGARKIAEKMLEQRIEALKFARLYKRPSRPVIRLPLPILTAAAAVFLLGVVIVGSTLLPGVSGPGVLVLASVVSSGTVMVGLLIAHGRERRRYGAETGARLSRELDAVKGNPDKFPRDAALALRRAENLIAQADVEVRLLTQRLLRNIGLVCVLLIPAVTAAAFQVFGDARIQVIVVGTIFETLMTVILAASRQRVRTLESDLREADYERGLLTDNDSSEARAEKLFLKHQFELKRYYDETLRQSAMLSYLGVLCMVGGFVVVGVAFYLIASENRYDAQQIIVATLAAAGGLLANFVALLYLRTHANTVGALTGFHQRLVGTHHVHFGNLLASRVDDGFSSEVLARMAVALASERADNDAAALTPVNGSGRQSLKKYLSKAGRQ